MTDEQILKLLQLVAAFDRRGPETITADDLEAWSLAALVAGCWSFELARRVVAEHYAAGAGKPRLTPAVITDRIRDLRRRAAASFELPRMTAAQLDVDGADPRWIRAQLAQHVVEVLGVWAAGGPAPDEHHPVQPALVRSVDELVARAPLELRPALAPARQLGQRVPAPGPRLDPHQRAAARAELDRVRPLAPAPAAGVPSPTHRTDDHGGTA